MFLLTECVLWKCVLVKRKVNYEHC
jgi:hypothetical protein